MTRVAPMRDDDVSNAADLYRAGFLPLKAAAWALARWRWQDSGRELTAEEVMKRFGASRSASYRVVSELKEAFNLESNASTVQDIGTDASTVQDIGTKIPETRTSSPAYRDDSVPEIGTESYTRDLQEEDIYPGGVPKCGTVDAIEAGARVLAENLQTDPLACYIRRCAHLPEVAALASDPWRLESAALRFLSPSTPEDVRGCRNLRASLNYLLSIARGLRAPYVPPSIAAAEADPGTNGEHRPPPPPRPRNPRLPRFSPSDFKDSYE